MEERSSAPPETGSRRRGVRRVAIGVLLVAGVLGPLGVAVAQLLRPPDPGRLVYAEARSILARDLASGETERVGTWFIGSGGFVLDPGGRRVAYSLRHERIHVLDLRTGQARNMRTRGTAAGWTPRGDLVVRTREGVLVVADDGQGAELTRFTKATLTPAGERVLTGPRWISGDLLAVGIGDPRLRWELALVDVTEPTPRIVHRIPGGTPLVVSPNRRQLLYAWTDLAERQRTEVRLLRIRDLATERVAEVGSVDGAVEGPRGLVAIWGRDRGGSGVWLLNPPSRTFERLVGAPEASHVSRVAWSADGERVYLLGGHRLRSVRVDGSDLRTEAEDVRDELLEVVRW